MSDSLLVAADVGNSAIKLMLVDADQPIESEALAQHSVQRTVSLAQPRWHQQVVDWVRSHHDRLSPGASQRWWVSTVNHAASDPLRQLCAAAARQSGRDFLWHQVDCREIPLAIQVDAPARLGIDRLVGAFAAAGRYQAPLVVVDVGSAVTVDWVLGPTEAAGSASNPEDPPVLGTFCGGAIFPGIRLQTLALSSGTEGLRQPAADGFPETVIERLDALTPGRNTADAIQVGVIAAVVGAIERLAEDYPRHATESQPAAETSPAGRLGKDGSGHRPTLVISGGDGPLISDHLRVPHVQIPHLVCRGLLDLARKRCRSTAGGLK